MINSGLLFGFLIHDLTETQKAILRTKFPPTSPQLPRRPKPPESALGTQGRLPTLLGLPPHRSLSKSRSDLLWRLCQVFRVFFTIFAYRLRQALQNPKIILHHIRPLRSLPETPPIALATSLTFL